MQPGAEAAHKADHSAAGVPKRQASAAARRRACRAAVACLPPAWRPSRYDAEMVCCTARLHACRAEAHLVPVRGDRPPPCDQLQSGRTIVDRPLAIPRRGWNVVPIRVLAHHTIGGEPRGEPSHAGVHLSDPGGGNSSLVPRIERGQRLTLDQPVERLGLSGIPRRIIAVLATVAQGPAAPGARGRTGYGAAAPDRAAAGWGACRSQNAARSPA